MVGLLVAGGASAFAYGLQQDAPRAWGSYLIGFFFMLSLALAGPFFTAAQYLSAAGWSVTVRRIPEAMSAALLPAALLAVGVFFGAHDLYHWTHAEAVQHDLVLLHKLPYLNLPRMGAFTVLAFAVWIGLSFWMNRNSRRQDRTGEARLTRINAYLGAAFMVGFALTYSTASFDFLMSLEPHWFSTMWAVYQFAILMQAGMAFMVLAAVLLRRTGQLDGFVTDHHIHDLGKLTFAFTVFWAYIAFSQFLLIWYANLPEETPFFLSRFEHGWGVLALALPLGKFILPFLLLLPRRMKHRPAAIVPIALWIIAITFVELLWIVMPAVSHQPLSLPWLELAVFAGFVGIFLGAFGLALSRHPLVPIKDPRLHEAVEHHQS